MKLTAKAENAGDIASRHMLKEKRHQGNKPRPIATSVERSLGVPEILASALRCDPRMTTGIPASHRAYKTKW
jgi:hypothetical protein